MRLMFAFLLLFTHTAFAQPLVKLVDGRVSAAKMGENPVLSGMLVNDGFSTVVVRGFSTEVARSVVVSEYTKNMKSGLLQEYPVPFVAVPAGKAIVLAPGGVEVRFLGLNRDLDAGTEVPVQLMLDDGEFQNVRVKVGSND